MGRFLLFFLFFFSFFISQFSVANDEEVIAAQVDACLHYKPGCPISNFHALYGNIYRGGRPDVQSLKTLAAMGVKTIIDLEDQLSVLPKFWLNIDDIIKEETEEAEKVGLKVLSFKTTPVFAIDIGLVKQVLAVMSDPSQGPFYIHCKYGRERTGLFIALHRVFNEKWNSTAAYREMRYFGFRPVLVPTMYRQFFRWIEQGLDLAPAQEASSRP